MTKAATAVEYSSNSKLGGMSTTYAAIGSCPASCPFLKAKACYGMSGPVMFQWNRLDQDASFVAVAKAEAAAIDELSGNQDLRIHTVGDCKTDQAAKLVSGAAERFMKRGRRKAFSFTHGWRNVKRESWGKVSVIASCETPADVEKAKDAGYATALVVPEFKQDTAYQHEGLKIVPCPLSRTDWPLQVLRSMPLVSARRQIGGGGDYHRVQGPWSEHSGEGDAGEEKREHPMIESIPIPNGAVIRYKYKGDWQYAVYLGEWNLICGPSWPKNIRTVYEAVWKKEKLEGRRILTRAMIVLPKLQDEVVLARDFDAELGAGLHGRIVKIFPAGYEIEFKWNLCPIGKLLTLTLEQFVLK